MIETDSVLKGLCKNPRSWAGFLVSFLKIVEPCPGSHHVPSICYQTEKDSLLVCDGAFDPSQAQFSYGIIGTILEQTLVVKVIEPE